MLISSRWLNASTLQDDEELLHRLRTSILHYYLEIYRDQTNTPSGIWYSNYLATLLNNRNMNLFYEDWSGYCDEASFKKEGYCIFQLQKNVSATDACKKLIKTLSVQDCGNVSQLVYYLAISDLVGKEVFDAYVAKSNKPLFIATYTLEAPKNSVLFDFIKEITIARPSVENKRPLQPCQLCYFRNYTAYLDKHPTGNAQGFNSIYLGFNQQDEQLYISFWEGGPKTEKEIVKLLKDKFLEPPDEWDLEYFAKHPKEKKEEAVNPDHQFFDDENIYTYVINLETIRSLLKS